MSAYLELKQKHQKEVDEFPMFFAFNNKQFDEGMAKLGLAPTDTGMIYKLGGTGGFYRRSDADSFKDMFLRHEKEMDDAIAQDATGEGFIFEMFNYELSNHEYIVTQCVDSTLAALSMTLDDINADPRLLKGFKKAIKHQLDWGKKNGW